MPKTKTNSVAPNPSVSIGSAGAALHPEHAAEAVILRQTQDALDRHVQSLERRDAAVADAETALNVEDAWREEAGVLKPHVAAPYYGCMVLTVGGRERRLYLGRASWNDLKGHEVIGWTSPVGQLFASTAESGKLGKSTGQVLLRRMLDIPARQFELGHVYDTYVRAGSGAEQRLTPGDAPGAEQGGPATENTLSQAEQQTLTDEARQSMLVSALSAQGGSAARRDIVATLQPEQDLLIRQLAQGVIAQGPAGSGKTAVLTHRCAWLASPERLGNTPTAAQKRGLLEADDISVIVPNAGLKASVQQACEALGMTLRREDGDAATRRIVRGLRVYTDTELVQQLAGSRASVVDRTGWLLHAARVTRDQRRFAWARAKVLGDWRMHECVRRFMLRRAAQQAGASKAVVIALPGGQEARAEPAWIAAQIMGMGEWKTLPGAVTQALTPRAAWARTKLLISRELQAQGAELHLAMDAAERAVSRFWRWNTPIMEVKNIEHSAALLADEVEEVIGKRHAALLRRPDPRTAAPVPREGWIDHLDLGLMLSFQEFSVQAGLAAKTGANAHDPGTMRQLLIDEAQDLSSLLIFGLARRWEGLTLAGDLSQGISGHRGLSTWAQAADAMRAARNLGPEASVKLSEHPQEPASGDSGSPEGEGEFRQVRYGELTRCYRSTREITEAAWPVAALWAKTAPAKAFDRSGAAVVLVTVEQTRAAKTAKPGEEPGEQDSPALWDALAEMCREMEQHEGRVLVVTRNVNLAARAETALRERDVDAWAVTGDGRTRPGQEVSLTWKPAPGSRGTAGAPRGEAQKMSALRQGVSIMDVVTAKGLEAGACIVLGADRMSYDPGVEHDARLLYVAMTRGMHRLGLIARGEPHPLLAHLGSAGPT